MYNKVKCKLMGSNTSSPIEKPNVDFDKLTKSFISEHCEICESKFMYFETFIHAFLQFLQSTHTPTQYTERMTRIEILKSLRKYGMENNGTDIYITGNTGNNWKYEIYISEHLKSTIVVGVMLVSWPRRFVAIEENPITKKMK